MKSKETFIKTTVIACLSMLLAISAYFLIKGWAAGCFRSMDSLRVYIASFGVWAPVVLILIQLFLTILPVCTSFTGCVVGAALLGASGGFWTNYIGISIGSIVAYTLHGLMLRKRNARKRKPETVKHISDCLLQHPLFCFRFLWEVQIFWLCQSITRLLGCFWLLRPHLSHPSI